MLYECNSSNTNERMNEWREEYEKIMHKLITEKARFIFQYILNGISGAQAIVER